MTSALPFGGGLYGFIRITLGPYMGINLLGAKYFWRSNMILVIISLLLFLVYYAVALPCADCRRYGGGMLDSVPKLKPAWLGESYVTQQLVFGLELLPLACSEAVNPKKTVPRAFLLSFTVIAINAFLLVIAVGCNAPGNAAVSLDFDTPLYHVFMSGLHVSKQVAKALVLPAMFVSAVVFGYTNGLLMRSMADSGLFPAVFKRVYGSERIPYVAQLVGAGLMLLRFLVGRFSVDVLLIISADMASIFVDMIVLLSFLRFQRAFSSLERGFQLSDKSGKYLSFVFFLGNMLIATMLYLWRVKSQQSLSSEEQRILFVAYVINTNRHKKNCKVNRNTRFVGKEKIDDTSLMNGEYARQKSLRSSPAFLLSILHHALPRRRASRSHSHARLHPAGNAKGQSPKESITDSYFRVSANMSVNCNKCHNSSSNQLADEIGNCSIQENGQTLFQPNPGEYEACLLDEDARSSPDADINAIEQFDIHTRLNFNSSMAKRIDSTDLIEDIVKVKATHCRVRQCDCMREDVEIEENENPSSLRHRTVTSRRYSVVCPLDDRGYSFPAVLSARHGFQQVNGGPQEMDEGIHLAEEVSKNRSRDLPHLLQRSFSRMLAKLSGSHSLDYGYEGYEVLLGGEDALSPLPRVGSNHED
eukprot:scaffold2084_cov170-Ochromonas_danica.AAC.1